MTVDSDPNPPRPCEVCGSVDHSTRYHDSGGTPLGHHDGGYPDTLETEEVLEHRGRDE